MYITFFPALQRLYPHHNITKRPPAPQQPLFTYKLSRKIKRKKLKQNAAKSKKWSEMRRSQKNETKFEKAKNIHFYLECSLYIHK